MGPAALVAALLLPLSGAVLIRLVGRTLRPHGGAIIATLAVGLAHAAAWIAFFSLVSEGPEARIHDVPLYLFSDVGGLRLEALLRWDPLSQIMLLVVTGIGFLIHLYSVAYMEGDDRYPFFFADLNLFVFSMLLLVLGGSFLLLFAGWELVGLSSYLLIGFWSQKPSAADAGRKAFLVNRIGDAGFVLGILYLAVHLGALDYTTVFRLAPGAFPHGSHAALVLALCLFCGAMGKSAQFPLHVWLPDAMEGPTPVSALIHAATMVTAGVYMVCRCHVLFEAAPAALAFVAWIGAFTALLAGSIAVTQNDLKRILAYSTVSQLGLMFLGAGVGAYDAAMFHLFTHAFFKALLFLGAGSVMHAMAGELDVWKMGGLRRVLPWTFALFLIGTLALTGAPLTAGFFSKDELLYRAFAAQPGGKALWAAGLLASLLTAFYSFRALILVFYGEARWDHHTVHPHESPWLMLGPLVVLAAGSLLAGVLWLPHLLGGFAPFEEFLEPVFGVPLLRHVVPTGQETAMACAVAVFLVGLGGALTVYRHGAELADRAAASLGGLYELVRDRWRFDELYDLLIVRNLFRVAGGLEAGVDRAVVDRTADGLGAGAIRVSRWGRVWQSGYIRHYALAFAAGAALLVCLPWLAAWIGGAR